MPQDKKYVVEELLGKAREIVNAEADAEFPQYATLIVENAHHAIRRLIYSAQETTRRGRQAEASVIANTK